MRVPTIEGLQSRRNDSGPGSEIKKGTYVYQPTSVINAPKILDLSQLINGSPAPHSARAYSLISYLQRRATVQISSARSIHQQISTSLSETYSPAAIGSYVMGMSNFIATLCWVTWTSGPQNQQQSASSLSQTTMTHLQAYITLD